MNDFLSHHNDPDEALWELPNNGQPDRNLHETLTESALLKLPRVPKVASIRLLGQFMLFIGNLSLFFS